jgi:Secretion system C-terminal sorting domain/Calcineurin-like phosphoesterase
MRPFLTFFYAVALFCCLQSDKIVAQTPNIILGRPTDTSMTASILYDQNVQYYIEYGTRSGAYPSKTATFTNKANTPDEIDMRALTGNTRYYYRVQSKLLNASTFTPSPEYYFQTQRAQGSTFRFLVNADEHLYDKKGYRPMYQVTLANHAKDSADFMLSLGDTFGDDHDSLTMTSASSDALHKDYRQYLGAVCHSLPFFFGLGNHEGELGSWLKKNTANNMAVYGTLWRKFYYPNPFPNTFYSGNSMAEGFGMDLPENYYAWAWGDALFVVLDVYRHYTINDKPENWDWTLGKTQYDWFKNTLTTSKAKHKFVFCHHTRGQGRGGAITAKGYEWGGYSGTAATNYQFDIYRPGWGKPIHQLMVDNGVKIFFQGHDHLYAVEKLDGMVYQETPMPADSSYQIGMLANADSYTDVTRDGTGHLRVTVSPTNITVDFVRAYLPKDTLTGGHKNREIGHTYTISTSTPTAETPQKTSFFTYPNPVEEVLTVEPPSTKPYDRRLDLVNLQGQIIQTQVLKSEQTVCYFNLKNMPAGMYLLRWKDDNLIYTQKVVVVK